MKIVFNDVCNLSELHVRVLPVRLNNDHQSLSYSKDLSMAIYTRTSNPILTRVPLRLSASHSTATQSMNSIQTVSYCHTFPQDFIFGVLFRQQVDEGGAVSDSREQSSSAMANAARRKIRLAVVRADNGQPVAGASVHYYQPENDHSKSKVVTDKTAKRLSL